MITAGTRTVWFAAGRDAESGTPAGRGPDAAAGRGKGRWKAKMAITKSAKQAGEIQRAVGKNSRWAGLLGGAAVIIRRERLPEGGSRTRTTFAQPGEKTGRVFRAPMVSAALEVLEALLKGGEARVGKEPVEILIQDPLEAELAAMLPKPKRAKTAKAAPEAGEPAAPKERAATAQAREDVLGFPKTRVLAWCGKQGFRLAEARALLEAHGAGTTDKTIRAFLYLGRVGKRPAAGLSKDQVAELLEFKAR